MQAEFLFRSCFYCGYSRILGYSTLAEERMGKTPLSLEELIKKFGPESIHPEQPDSENWKESEVLVCRVCFGPASLHPKDENVLGCVKCSFAVEGIHISAFFAPMALFEESDEIIATD